LFFAAFHVGNIHLNASTLYVTMPGLGSVAMFAPDSGQALGNFATGFQLPTGLAFDSAGNLFVADLGTNSIFKIQPDGTKSLFASIGLNRPMDLVFDPSGDLFVANDGGSTIVKFNHDGAISGVADGGGLNHPTSLASDSNGNVYAANTGSGAITKTTPAGTTSSFGPVLDTSQGLAFDSTETLFVVEYLSSAISKIGPEETITPFVIGLEGGFPSDLAFGEGDNLFVAYSDTDLVGRITPNGLEATFTIGASPLYLAVGPDPVPEPSALALMLIGMSVLWFGRFAKGHACAKARSTARAC
jgi:DNA-binding beta-propeller fold protein YncE